MITGKEALALLGASASRWNAHNAPRLGASLAYYALLSLAPLSILLVAIASLIFSRSAAESNLLQQLERVIGHSGAQTLRTVIDASHHPGSGAIAGIAAAVALFFGASGVFVELRNSLNQIWDVPAQPWSGWRGLITQRLVSFVTILVLGGLLLASLLVTAVLGVVARFLGDLIPAGTIAGGEILNLLVSPVIIAALFVLIFKFVPDVPIAWRDVLGGAVVTSILFSLGRTGLSFYLRTAGVGSAYGAAGSLVALVVWVYYSAQIFFFGAILTRIYAERHGSRALH
ncbi:MAG TPA: YihY/virulence factor BrkB family protein [Bryobacteraceae bacterium]